MDVVGGVEIASTHHFKVFADLGSSLMIAPYEFPAWGTVYCYFRRGSREEVWDTTLKVFRMEVRQKQGRSAAVIDSQSIPHESSSRLRKGLRRGKKTWGCKRHLLVDSQGYLLAVKVLAANGSDQEGGKTLLSLSFLSACSLA